MQSDFRKALIHTFRTFELAGQQTIAQLTDSVLPKEAVGDDMHHSKNPKWQAQHGAAFIQLDEPLLGFPDSQALITYNIVAEHDHVDNFDKFADELTDSLWQSLNDDKIIRHPEKPEFDAHFLPLKNGDTIYFAGDWIYSNASQMIFQILLKGQWSKR
jgi:hypothetical protein